MTKILVVDDEPQLLRALRITLRARGYEVDTAPTGAAALQTAARRHPELILLDLGLPDLDGIEVIEGLRPWYDGPIVVLSARHTTDDKVLALDAGADDYVTKPFDPRELVARIHAVTRRAARAVPELPIEDAPASAAPTTTIAGPGGVELDVERREVTVDGAPVALTRKEFNLLAMLARQPGIVFTRSRILAEVWDSAWIGNQRTLEVHVAAVRAKLGVAGIIETVRGVGYRYPAG